MSAFGKLTKRSGAVTTPGQQASWRTKLQNVTGATALSATRRRILYLLIDCSGSMADQGKLESAKSGAARFSHDAAAKGYSTGIIAFSCEAVCLADPQDAAIDVAKVLYGVPASGSTDLTAALTLAAKRLRARSGERAVCIVTDGMPDDRASAVRAAVALQTSGVNIMALGTDDADKEFLDQIVTSKELAVKVPRQQLLEGVANMALLLPG
ncbi:MAG: vWA domain-containing protein [Chthoniobacterales bacterium]